MCVSAFVLAGEPSVTGRGDQAAEPWGSTRAPCAVGPKTCHPWESRDGVAAVTRCHCCSPPPPAPDGEMPPTQEAEKLSEASHSSVPAEQQRDLLHNPEGSAG